MYTYKAKVIEVIDGDTMIIDMDLGFEIHHVHRFRILKYDAPEIFHPLTPEEKQLGLEAKDYAMGLLMGVDIVIVTKKDRLDKYGRYLCSITLPKGDDFATVMTKKGFIKS